MAILIGGDKAYLKRSIGGFVVSYQWLNNQPAMFIARNDRFTEENRPTVVIKLEDAHLYSDNRNNPTEHLFIYAYKAAVYLGFQGEYAIKESAKKLTTIVLEGIPDLICMPPEPMGLNKEQEVGEVLIKINGKTVTHKEVAMPQGAH